jgi:hypothetical protein
MSCALATGMKAITRILAAVLLTTTATTPASAAAIVRSGDHIILTGSIEGGDADRLKSALAPGVKTVDLDSDGGVLTESLALGRAIRQQRLVTIAHGDCRSGCALAWAGGVKRLVAAGGHVGWHCPVVAWQCQKGGRDLALEYLAQMNATPAMLARQADAGSTASLYLTAQEISEAEAVADGRYDTEQEWQEPPPPRRRPPPPEQYYGPRPVPPGFLIDPWGQKIVPCLLMWFGIPRCI